jgi:hypothetical protein
MMDMLFFFDVPVYRLPKEKYYAERESYIEKQMYGTDPNEIALRKAFYERNKDSAILSRDYLEKTYGGPGTSTRLSDISDSIFWVAKSGVNSGWFRKKGLSGLDRSCSSTKHIR